MCVLASSSYLAILLAAAWFAAAPASVAVSIIIIFIIGPWFVCVGCLTLF